jgi:peptidoglycan hydrolase-like protein with peptidoglycan-binding domain
LSGNKFSVTTGQGCASFVSASASASAFGQQVRAIAINLGKGSRNNNVAILQQFLISQNKGSAAQALAGVGATAYFGNLTRAALAEFQASAGINPPLGNFGPITRAYLNANY